MKTYWIGNWWKYSSNTYRVDCISGNRIKGEMYRAILYKIGSLAVWVYKQ